MMLTSRRVSTILYLHYKEMGIFKTILNWFYMWIEKKNCLFLDRTFTEKEENYHQEIQNLKIKIQVCLVYILWYFNCSDGGCKNIKF